MGTGTPAHHNMSHSPTHYVANGSPTHQRYSASPAHQRPGPAHYTNGKLCPPKDGSTATSFGTEQSPNLLYSTLIYVVHFFSFQCTLFYVCFNPFLTMVVLVQ